MEQVVGEEAEPPNGSWGRVLLLTDATRPLSAMPAPGTRPMFLHGMAPFVPR